MIQRKKGVSYAEDRPGKSFFFYRKYCVHWDHPTLIIDCGNKISEMIWQRQFAQAPKCPYQNFKNSTAC